eukprot:EG_transcript_2386
MARALSWFRASMQSAPVPPSPGDSVSSAPRRLASARMLLVESVTPSQSPSKPILGGFRIPVLLLTCLLAISIAGFSTTPVIVVSVLKAHELGYDLLAEVASQHFNLLHSNVKAALDEADQWMDYLDGWLLHEPPPLTSSRLEPLLRKVMLPWMAKVAKRVGGVCLDFTDEIEAGKNYSLCASRMDLPGRRDLFWEHPLGDLMMYRSRVDRYWNLGEVIDSWGIDVNYSRAQTLAHDGAARWRGPWTWKEQQPDGSVKIYTEVGLSRRTDVDGIRFNQYLWMQNTDWTDLLRLSLQKFSGVAADSATAFLCNVDGTLIASTCGVTQVDGELVNALESECPVVSQTFRTLQFTGRVDSGDGGACSSLHSGGYMINMQRVVTSRGDVTPYLAVLATPYSAVDEPVRCTVSLLVGISVATLAGSCIAAVLFTSRVIAHPLKQVAWDMYRCVQLNIGGEAGQRQSCVRELSLMMESFAKMKVMLETVARFLPVEVLQPCLQQGTPVALSMVPTSATVFFLDVEDFTHLTETLGAAQLVLSIGVFFEELSTIVVRRSGVIDKYIGDCLMAFWNTPSPVEDHEYAACRAALECADWMAHGQKSPIRLTGRIGLESGPVHAGIFGSRHRMNYTVVGDVVNVASRLEGLNKEHRTRILIGPQLYAAVAQRVVTRRLERVVLKGKAAEMNVYELLNTLPVVLTDCVPPSVRSSSPSFSCDVRPEAACTLVHPEPTASIVLQSEGTRCL